MCKSVVIVRCEIRTALPPRQPTCYIDRQGHWAKMELATVWMSACYINRQGHTQGPLESKTMTDL